MLNLKNYYFLTNKSFETIQKLKDLTFLDLSGNFNLTKEHLKSFDIPQITLSYK